MPPSWCAALGGWCSAVLLVLPCWCQALDPGTRWEIGERFRHRAATHTFDVFWDQGELRDEVQFLSRQYGLAWMLDRRVDPNQLISLRERDQSFEQILWRLAEPRELAVVQLNNIFYVGPIHEAACLPQLLSELEQQLRSDRLPNSLSRAWLATRPLVTRGETIEPQRALFQVLDDMPPSTLDINRVPHDLWYRIDWPEMPRYQQVALLLVGFGLWLEFDNEGRGHVVEFPQRTTVTRHYAAVRDGAQLQRQLRQDVAGLRVEFNRDGLMAEGTPQQIALASRRVADWMQPPRRAEADTTFSLKTRGSRRAILAAIAEQTERSLFVDAQFEEALRQVIDLDAADVSLPQLIADVLRGVEARSELTERELRIVPK